MKIADKYVPQELEGKWYDYWLRNPTADLPIQ